MTPGIEQAGLECSGVTGLMRNDIDKPLCDHCGQTLENFLNQMEEHNLEVVCPSCGKTQSGLKHVHEEGDNGGGSASSHPSQPTNNKAAQPGFPSGPSKKQEKH